MRDHAYRANAGSEADTALEERDSMRRRRSGSVSSADRHTAVVVDIRSGDPAIELRPVPAADGPRSIQPGTGLLGASSVSLAAKRALDIVGAITLLTVLSPLLLTLALLIKTTSRGPVLYVSDRTGKDGKVFKFLKFRSMEDGSEARKSELTGLNEATGPVFKIRNDPRVTPIGRWIRKYSLDELPQLVNVLKGEMSLVGPRPPTCDEVRSYSSLEYQRLLVKPGLTCIWQVRGRSDLDFEQWVNLDLDYIESWSLTLDARLLLLTVPAVLSGRGAY